MKNFYCLLSVILLLLTLPVFAQPSVSKMKSRLSGANSLQAKGLQMSVVRASQAGILFSAEASLRQDQAVSWLSDQLQLRPGKDALAPDTKTINNGDLAVSKLHQYYNGIKVEHGVISATGTRRKNRNDANGVLCNR